MESQWKVVREKFPLSGLTTLSAATGGASDSWHFAEPTVAEVQEAMTRGGKDNENETISRLVSACVMDADSNKVFGKNPGFKDLPSRAAGELAKFAMDQIAPKRDEAEGTPEAEGGKP